MSAFRFEVLRTHGVSAEGVAALERAFGTFPATIEGPADAFEWGLGMLPWEHLRRIVRRWATEAFAAAEVVDSRATSALALVEYPSILLSGMFLALAHDVVAKLAEGRDVQDLSMTDPTLSPALRAWLCLASAVGAAHVAVGGAAQEKRLAPVRTLVMAAFGWRATFAGEQARERILEQAFTDIFNALAASAATWVKGAHA